MPALRQQSFVVFRGARPNSMNFPVYTQLAGNFPKSHSLETASSSAESVANLISGATGRCDTEPEDGPWRLSAIGQGSIPRRVFSEWDVRNGVCDVAMQEALIVHRETHIPAPPAAVFALLTYPEKILRWMGTEA